jgi:RNA polymerase sigma-70 factor (ECF subfamily)
MITTNASPNIDEEVVDRLPRTCAEVYREEADLAARIRTGDEQACATLVRRHSGALLACARRLLGCEEESADAVQEAFLSAFQSIDTFAGNARLGTWLHRTVINQCFMMLRKRRRRTVRIDDLLPAFDETGHHTRPVAPWTAHPEEQLSQAETRAQVRACIDRLPELYRAVLLLRDIEEVDTGQTAELLGISRGAVKTRLHRARQALRTLLEPIFRTE